MPASHSVPHAADISAAPPCPVRSSFGAALLGPARVSSQCQNPACAKQFFITSRPVEIHAAANICTAMSESTLVSHPCSGLRRVHRISLARSMLQAVHRALIQRLDKGRAVWQKKFTLDVCQQDITVCAMRRTITHKQTNILALPFYFLVGCDQPFGENSTCHP